MGVVYYSNTRCRQTVASCLPLPDVASAIHLPLRFTVIISLLYLRTHILDHLLWRPGCAGLLSPCGDGTGHFATHWASTMRYALGPRRYLEYRTTYQPNVNFPQCRAGDFGYRFAREAGIEGREKWVVMKPTALLLCAESLRNFSMHFLHIPPESSEPVHQILPS
ncbi:hypothetical protein EDC04DRAFT_944776 [Pisolithus marmoratus]|nr:hypothetical protein EDC04DRAFT_944776 [Pisolithus marmoratus]